MGYPDECGDMSELEPTETVFCEDCGDEFETAGDWHGDGRDEERTFEPENPLCLRCRERATEHDVAFILTPSGKVHAAPKPEDDGTFSLKQMQKAVGGYIQILNLPNDLVMVVNEEGKMHKLRVNPIASAMREHIQADTIVGSVLICTYELIQ